MSDVPIPDISLRDLWSVQLTREEKSVTAAALRLGISQAALSRRLQKLEQRLGVALFDRQARHLELTDIGETFAAFAERTTESFGESMSTLRKSAHLIEGELRIASSAAPGVFLVPDWVQRFLSEHQGCTPRLSRSDSDTVIADVLEGNWDIGFVAKKPATDLVRWYAVAEDEVVLAVPSSHRLAGRTEVELGELAGERFIDRTAQAATSLLVDEVLRSRGLSLPELHTVMSVDDGQVLVMSLERGMGVCWLSVQTIRRGRTAGIHEVRIKGIDFRRELYMIHSRRALPTVADAFVRWLRADIGASPMPVQP